MDGPRLLPFACERILSGQSRLVMPRFGSRRAALAYVARHGLTSAAYQKEFVFDVGRPAGLSPQTGEWLERGRTGFLCRNLGEDPWACVRRSSRHDLPQVYQQEFDKWAGQGYCITLVSGYSGWQPRPTAARCWEQKACPAVCRASRPNVTGLSAWNSTSGTAWVTG